MVSKWGMKGIAFLDLHHWSQATAITITPIALAGSEGILGLLRASERMSRYICNLPGLLSPVKATPACFFQSYHLTVTATFSFMAQFLSNPVDASSLCRPVLPHHTHCFSHSVFLQMVSNDRLAFFLPKLFSYLYYWCPFCSILAS